MCGSMVDIHSATAEIRRERKRKKEERTRNVGQCPTWWPPCQIQVAPSVQRRKVWLTATTPWAVKTEPIYFCLSLREKSTDFNAVFTVRINDERYMWQYELHPPHLINVATLPCESRNSKNVILQWDITKENCIKRIVYASSKWICGL